MIRLSEYTVFLKTLCALCPHHWLTTLLDSIRPPSPLVKQEDVDQLDPSPSPTPSAKTSRPKQQLHLNTNVPISINQSSNANATSQPAAQTQAPPKPSTNPHPQLNSPSPTLSRSQHPHKRRRVTISGVANPSSHPHFAGDSPHHGSHHYQHHDFTVSHTPPGTTGSNTPISPVVMGFTMGPQTIEQVRAMLAVKQKQKALIESRRGSINGGPPPMSGGTHTPDGRRASNAGIGADSMGRRASFAAVTPVVNIVNPTPTTAVGPGPGSSTTSSGPGAAAASLRRTGSSPNGVRILRGSPSMSPNARTTGLVAAGRTRSPSLLGQGAPTVSRAHSPPHPSQNSSQQIRTQVPGSVTLSPPIQQTRAAQAGRDLKPNTRSPPRHGSSQAQAPQQTAPAASAPVSTGGATPNSSSFGGPSQATVNAAQSLTALAHNLPPPPNSFARRRASQLGIRGNKPADLLISPREKTSEVDDTKQSAGDKPPNSVSLPQNVFQAPLRSPSSSLSQTQNRVQSLETSMAKPLHCNASSNNNQTSKAFVPISSTFKMHQPVIQSAPPRPGQQPGRFPSSVRAVGTTGGGMALPSLPPSLSQTKSPNTIPSIRRVPGQVPPTPTRLLSSLQGPSAPGTQENASVRLSQPTRGPPRTATGATFAISHGSSPVPNASSIPSNRSSLLGLGAPMPSTPVTLTRPSAGGQGTAANAREKAAFMAPFEAFYDALSDAQMLKNWFSEQLKRVGAVVKEGQEQVDRLKGISAPDRPNLSSAGGMSELARTEVERMVREAVMLEARAWRDEVEGLRGQVAELQRALAGAVKPAPSTGGSFSVVESPGSIATSSSTKSGGKGWGKGKMRSGTALNGTPTRANGSAAAYSSTNVDGFSFPLRHQAPSRSGNHPPSSSILNLQPPTSAGRSVSISPAPSVSNGHVSEKKRRGRKPDTKKIVAREGAFDSELESEEMNTPSPPAPNTGVAPVQRTESTPVLSSQNISPVDQRHDQPENNEVEKRVDDDAMDIEHGATEMPKKYGSNVSAMRFERNERHKSPTRDEKEKSSPPPASSATNATNEGR